MEDNVMKVLQMLQDGKISASEAEMLISALRKEGGPTPPAGEPVDAQKEEKPRFSGFDRIKAPKIDLDNLGDIISSAVSKIQPETDRIVKKVQTQIRTATRTGAHWGASVTARVRTWTEDSDVRPENPDGLAEHVETHDYDNHLEAVAPVFVDNPLGNVKVVGTGEGRATVNVRKAVWGGHDADLRRVAEQVNVSVNGTDTRLDIKVDAPESFRDGTVDLEIKLPRAVAVRVSTHFGAIDISDIDGKVEAASTSGEVKLNNLGADARAESVSGDLALNAVAGAATVGAQTGDIRATDIRRGLSANTASGEVEASRIEGGRVECKSVSGDVKVEIVGTLAPLDITVESISGDATLTDANGNIAMKAVSGDIRGDQLTATRLQAQTMSGDVRLDLRELFSGTMHVTTVSGDVALALREGSNARVSLSTSSGDLRCEHDAHNVVATETLWTGQIGTGAGTLTVQTISGDASIRRA